MIRRGQSGMAHSFLASDPDLAALGLRAAHAVTLPPEVRDQLLEYLSTWGSPADLLVAVELLREAHGPLLFLLDYEATAHFRLGDYGLALEINDRRQRRSSTIASQALDAQLMLATGHLSHAEAAAADIGRAYPRSIVAVNAAAAVFAGLCQYERAAALLDAFLAQRPGDIAATVTAASIADAAGQSLAAGERIEQLGAGLPSGIDDFTLQQLAHLLETLGHAESGRAARLELDRRRHLHLQSLAAALAPILNLAGPLLDDPERVYRHISGPESIAVPRDVRRHIQLEAIRHFGFGDLRAGQAEAIATVLRRESILVVMPTGAGKSLCYQLPALILPRATLVISPLIALMKDQVEGLPTVARRRAIFINSTLSDAELAARLSGVARGAYSLIYAAPERLRQRTFLRALREAGIDLFVVDEAHCVSLWGHDFRPDYLFLQEARHELGAPPALAITATAPPRVRDEIIDYIADSGPPTSDPDDEPASHAPRPRVLALDIFRANITLSALQFHNEDEKLTAVTHFVTHTPGSGIVYVNSRHKSESLAFALRGAGVAAEAYHAGLEDRNAIQDRFMSDDTRVVVATIAFGMGIDKPNIRFIVHFHPSRSLAAYYQEVGRAGRDGGPSQGILFYSNNDWANLRRWAKADEYSIDFLERVYLAVVTQIGTASGGSTDPAPSAQFGVVDPRRLQQVLDADETMVRVAISMLERIGVLARSFDFPEEATITLPAAPATPADLDPDFVVLRKGLNLRPGQEATYKSRDLARFMGCALNDLEPSLFDWQSAGWLRVRFGRHAMLIEAPPRPDDMRARLERMLAQTAAVALRRIDDVIGYATNETCRHGYISAHFGSPPRTRCTVCDNCTGDRPSLPGPRASHNLLIDDVDIEPMILDCLISLPKPVGRSGLARILAGSLRAPVPPDKARHSSRLRHLGEAAVMTWIDDLIESNRLRQFERNGYPVLAPTLSGRAEAEVWLADHPELADYGATPDGQSAPTASEAAVPPEADIYTSLQKAIWQWRRRCAEQFGQPPYMIISNEIILRISESRPQTIEALGALPGMGPQRLTHYGGALLDLVQLNPAEPGDTEKLAAQRANPGVVGPRLPAESVVARISARAEHQIYARLQELRQKVAVQEGVKPYLVANNTLLKTIAHVAPSTILDLERIPGFRSSGLRPHSTQIMTLIAAVLVLS